MIKHEPEIRVSHIKELYYLISVENLDNILKNGMLSHKRAHRRFEPTDISNQDVQLLREKKILRVKPGKKQLVVHQHVNFYIQPHNAMMHNKFSSGQTDNLCVLRIRKEIFKRGDGVLSDRNAAVSKAAFFKAEDWKLTNKSAEVISSPYLKGVTPPRYLEDAEFEDRKQIRQSEALFPYEVNPGFISGVFVNNQAMQLRVERIIRDNKRADISVLAHPSLFMSLPVSHTFKLEQFTPLPELTTEEVNRLNFSSPPTSPDTSDNEDDSSSENSSAAKSDDEDSMSISRSSPAATRK